MDRAHDAKKRFFVWFNSTRVHIFMHLKHESQGVTGLGTYPDDMVEYDGQVGQLLKKLDDLGIAKNTVVIYTNDNGAEAFSWPDGGTTPALIGMNSNAAAVAQLWLFIIAPLIGAGLAGVLYREGALLDAPTEG